MHKTIHGHFFQTNQNQLLFSPPKIIIFSCIDSKTPKICGLGVK